jgi:hypothetical protein
VEPAWGLLIPPLLTLLDASFVPVKTKACRLLSVLLEKLANNKSTLLKRTGLAPVFWDALMPTLMFLPPLTPLEEALPLLRAAYETLIQLANTREPEPGRQRSELLDRVMREGVERGISFSGEKVQVSEVLMEAVEKLVLDMGVWAVRHLKVRSLLWLVSDWVRLMTTECNTHHIGDLSESFRYSLPCIAY